MKKKRVLSLMTVFVLLVTVFLISGCLPPNYSKEKAEKIAKEHQPEALAWFSKNMPDAKPDSDCKAYEMGTNLLGAVKGSYKRNGKSYKYVYEYTNKKMYVGEGYEESCRLVEDIVLKDFGYSKEEAEVSFHGYKFIGKNENDKPRGNYEEQKEEKEFYSDQEKLRPADKTPEQFAQAIVDPDTKEKLDFYIHLYRDTFPEQQLEKQKRYKNLGSIWCNVKIDLTKENQGAFAKVYLKNKVQDRYYHVEKIADGLYGGYISVNGLPEAGDKLRTDYKPGKYLILEIPKGTKPVIFSNSSLNLVHRFKNSKGDTIEVVAEELYKSSKTGINGYHQYDTGLFLKDNISYGYSHITTPLVGGIYRYEVLSFFDLSYWKLKFFD